jgi:hypothetical protein
MQWRAPGDLWVCHRCGSIWSLATVGDWIPLSCVDRERVPSKTKAEIAFDYIAGLRAGVEQDIAELDKRWPMYKRGANANRVFQSLVNRIKAAIETAEEEVVRK